MRFRFQLWLSSEELIPVTLSLGLNLNPYATHA